jgi:hypothetical protein
VLSLLNGPARVVLLLSDMHNGMDREGGKREAEGRVADERRERGWCPKRMLRLYFWTHAKALFLDHGEAT